MYSYNLGGDSIVGDRFCDVLDAYRLKVQPVKDNVAYHNIHNRYTGNPDVPYRYFIHHDDGNYTDGVFHEGNNPDDIPIPYIVEYASDYVDNSFLSSQGGDTTVQHRDDIKRECTHPDVNWTMDFEAAMSGSVGVTKVRLRLKPGIEMPPGAGLYFWINHKVRDVDLATGQPMNSGDLIVNYAGHKFGYQDDWTWPSYIPGTYPGADRYYYGDRVIYAGAKVGIKKLESRTAAALADEIIYTLQTTFLNDMGVQGYTGDMKIIDILPENFRYIAGTTVTLKNPPQTIDMDFPEPMIGICQDAIDANATIRRPCDDDKNQVLIWDLGDDVPISSAGIPDVNYTVQIGAKAHSGTNYNTATIIASQDISPVLERTSEVGIAVDIPSSFIIVKKTVNNPDYPEQRERTTEFKEIWFSIDIRSGYDNDIHNIDVIDVIPFKGDGEDNALKFAGSQNQKRNLNTDYHGDMYFSRANFTQSDDSAADCNTADVKYYYTDITPGDIDQAPTVGTANNLGSADSIWCEGTADGPSGCTITSSGHTFPAGEDGLKAVTAVRAKGAAMRPQAICQMWVDIKVRNNLKGDVYSNTAGSSVDEVINPVLSIPVAASVVGSSLGDFVWFDRDKDGIQDNNETSISGVKVHLLDDAGNAVNNPLDGNPYIVETDAGGKYLFDKLNAGTYKIRFKIPEGYAVGTKGAGGDSKKDSDAAQDVGADTATTDAITLEKAEDYKEADLALVIPRISGHVYDDGNGDNNVNGTAISAPDGTQLYATLVDDGGAVLVTTPIAADGTYRFESEDGVRANKRYSVVISTIQHATTSTLPAKWGNTGENINATGAGNDDTPDGIVAVNMGITSVSQVDFGIDKSPVSEDLTVPARSNPSGDMQYPVPPLPIDDLEEGIPTTVTFGDLPDLATVGTLYYNGVPVAAGQAIEHFDSSRLTVDPVDGNPTVVFSYTATNVSGFESDPATVSMPFLGEIHLGDTVWSDYNSNGVQDAGEKGVEGVDVVLLDKEGDVIDMVTTDESGHYEFAIREPGKYRVRFDEAYYYIKVCSSCGDEIDSNVHGLNNTTNLIEMDWGDDNMTIDAGVTPTAHIGDYFWYDDNNNGIQDPDERGVKDGLIALLDVHGKKLYWEDTAHSGLANENKLAVLRLELTTSKTDNPVETRTGLDGRYGLDVPVGKYKVRFTMPTKDREAGFMFTSVLSGSNAKIDSDVDEDGVLVAAIDVAAGKNKINLDAGIKCGCSDIQSDNANALGGAVQLLVLLTSLGMGLLFIRREEYP
jgi:hypothetical protein